MIKNLTVGAAVAGALAAGAPGASATHYRGDCQLHGYQHDGVSGSYAAVVSGYAAGYTWQTMAVSCEVRINGVTVATTPPRPPVAGLVVVANHTVAFEATDADDVDVCLVVVGNVHNHEACYQTQVREVSGGPSPLRVLTR